MFPHTLEMQPLRGLQFGSFQRELHWSQQQAGELVSRHLEQSCRHFQWDHMPHGEGTTWARNCQLAIPLGSFSLSAIQLQLPHVARMDNFLLKLLMKTVEHHWEVHRLFDLLFSKQTYRLYLTFLNFAENFVVTIYHINYNQTHEVMFCTNRSFKESIQLSLYVRLHWVDNCRIMVELKEGVVFDCCTGLKPTIFGCCNLNWLDAMRPINLKQN